MKTLFLDYDGTLNDSDSIFIAKLDGLFGASGQELLGAYMNIHREIVHKEYPDKHEDIDFHIGLLLRRTGREHNDGDRAALRHRFKLAQDACLAAEALYSDALPFLNRVRDSRVNLCLATGDYAQAKAQGLERLGGRKYFIYLFDREILGANKGDGEYFRRALRAVTLSPEQAVVLGDSPGNDIAPAKELGILTIWINRKGIPFPLEDAKPDHEVSTLLEALQFL